MVTSWDLSVTVLEDLTAPVAYENKQACIQDLMRHRATFRNALQ